MKIIKYGFVAVVGAFLLPAPPENHFMVANTGQRINLETGEVLAAAASTYSDVTNFCQRQSAVCSTAGQAWASLEIKVKYNFQRIYEWSNGTSQDQMRIPVLPKLPQQQISAYLPKQNPSNTALKLSLNELRNDRLHTGSIVVQMANANTDYNTNNTLQIEDLIPEWRGPVLTGTG